LIARITGLSRPTIYKILGPVGPDLEAGRRHNLDRPNGRSNVQSES
jgi:hypothetical protein